MHRHDGQFMSFCPLMTYAVGWSSEAALHNNCGNIEGATEGLPESGHVGHRMSLHLEKSAEYRSVERMGRAVLVDLSLVFLCTSQLWS